MLRKLLLTEDAKRDLEDISAYVAEHDAPGKAEALLGRIEKIVERLSGSPDRGYYPTELSALDIREYRQVFYNPYRIIYNVRGKRVYIYLIADGRRDFQTLLARRLLSP